MVPEMCMKTGMLNRNGQLCITPGKRNCLAKIFILLVNRKLYDFKKNEFFYACPKKTF